MDVGVGADVVVAPDVDTPPVVEDAVDVAGAALPPFPLLPQAGSIMAMPTTANNEIALRALVIPRAPWTALCSLTESKRPQQPTAT